MFESLVAVPLIWLRLPFHFALPLVTHLISGFPFFYVSRKLYLRKKEKSAFTVLLLYFFMSWKWDLLTSVPRNLINGMPFAVIGTVLLNEKGGAVKAFLGSLLAGMGAIMTNTAGIIVAIGIAYYFINIRKNHRQIFAVISGLVVSLFLYVVILNFYLINSDFMLHGSGKGSIDIATFLRNIRNVVGILGAFCFIRPNILGGGIAVAVIAIFIASCVKCKHRITLALIILGTVLFLLLCSITKTNDFNKDSILFSQTRMFLFVPYAALIILYFDFIEYDEFITKSSYSGKSKIKYGIFPLILIVMFFKIYPLERALRNVSSALYNPYACGLYTTKSILNAVSSVLSFAKDNDCDVIVTKDGARAFSYALGAYGFQKFTVYNAVYDRRTWVYHSLRHTTPHKVLLIDFSGNKEIIHIEGVSVVDYLAENYGFYRRPYQQDDKRTVNQKEGKE